MTPKSIVILISIFILLNIAPAISQECGPGCPICSGSGNAGAALIAPGTIIVNSLFIPKGEEETAIFGIRGGITSWLDAGIGYSVKVEKLIWSARVQVFGEDKKGWKPALLVGTGSVRMGRSDQSLYFQLIKSWTVNKTLALGFSGGVASLLPEMHEYYGLAGFNLTIGNRWTPFINYDGINLHPGMTCSISEWLKAGIILIESKELAVSLSVNFNLKSK